jgi:glycosyltransferase involved in cell wall biosynthesis
VNMSGAEKIGVVVIGRNEGERLVRCLTSVRTIPRCVYVDSGSTDGSVSVARGKGVAVIELEIPPHFTAARARNAGLMQLLANYPDLQFVQMVDGDCEVHPRWIESALEFLSKDSRLALVFGRRRERHPERSIYNALCDDEWDVPVGPASGVGGDALFRVAALREVNFYNGAMIAGEDTELAMRLRKCGWQLHRVDAEMTLHDANIVRFGQWWNRTRRSGHAYGEMAFLHPDARDPNWPRTVRSIWLWGVGIPGSASIATLLALTVDSRWWIGVALPILACVLNITRLALRQKRRGLSAPVARASAFLLMLGKVPQLLGLIGYHRDRLSGRVSRLIEYKAAAHRGPR